MRTHQLSFFNTIDLSGDELRRAQDQCNKQEKHVLFCMRDGNEMTPFEVHQRYCSMFTPAPITSIRRAMTVLTKRGLLRKTFNMAEGAYGKPNYKWKIII